MSGCSSVASPADFLAKNAYLSLRIVNNELGSLLKEYKLTALKKAQEEVDVEAAQKCQASDAACRIGVKDKIAGKYAEREMKYNEATGLQRDVKRLLGLADNTCATLTAELCESAKNDALRNKRDVERFWKEVSGWTSY